MISFLVTSRGGRYLDRTIEDLRANAAGDIEIVLGLDGVPNMIKADADQIVHSPQHIGQRAMLNKLAKTATYDIVAKVDAHCTFGPDFDTLLLEDFTDNIILAPVMYPLDGETWVVNHHNKMGKFAFNYSMAVDHLPGDGESMCMQGSFFMTTKHNWFNWNLCDETLGSWGHQGTELGLQAFFNAGTCFISSKTYYAHMFKHEEKDFEYKRDLSAIDVTHEKFIAKFRNKRIAPLIEKWNYPLDWTQEKVSML